MTTCPVCGQPMTLTHPSNGLPRHFCSQTCAGNTPLRSQAEVDPAAVDRLIHGEPVARTTWAERVEACRILRARGRSYTQVADALHVDPRSIARYVAEIHNGKEAA